VKMVLRPLSTRVPLFPRSAARTVHRPVPRAAVVLSVMPDGSSFPTWSAITSSVVPMHDPCCPKCRYLGLQRPHFTHPRGPSSFQTLPTDVFSLPPQTYRGAAYLLCICCHSPDLDRHSLLVWSTTHHWYPVDPGSCS
jgi:hypothetical protein